MVFIYGVAASLNREREDFSMIESFRAIRFLRHFPDLISAPVLNLSHEKIERKSIALDLEKILDLVLLLLIE